MSSLDKISGKLGILHVIVFLLFFEAPRNQPTEAHLVSATPFLGVLVRAHGILPLHLFLGAGQRIAAVVQEVEDRHILYF